MEILDETERRITGEEQADEVLETDKEAEEEEDSSDSGEALNALAVGERRPEAVLQRSE